MINGRLNLVENELNKRVHVENLGPLASLKLPPGWIEVPQANSYLAQQSCARDFCAADDSNVVLSIYSRGYPVSKSAASKFDEILRFAHVLQAEEINSITEILSKIAEEDAFNLRSAYTADISGRLVLFIDGLWKTSQTQYYGVMFKSDDSLAIYEIFFEAGSPGFIKYLDEVKESLRSVEWKG